MRCFPWRALHRVGIGRWVEPDALIQGPSLRPHDHGPAVAALQELLSRLGYAIDASGSYDTWTTQVVTAFQRHFRPAQVDGVCDPSTLSTLRKLLTSAKP